MVVQDDWVKGTKMGNEIGKQQHLGINAGLSNIPKVLHPSLLTEYIK